MFDLERSTLRIDDKKNEDKNICWNEKYMYLLLVSATSSTQHQHEVETQERSNSVLANQVRQSVIHIHHASKYLHASTEHLLNIYWNHSFTIISPGQTAYNVSKLLDSLLQDYDNSLRPDFAGEDTGGL